MTINTAKALYDEISKDEFDTAFLKWIQNINNI